MNTSESMRGPWPGMDAGYVKIRKSEFGINAMKKLLTLAGCFAAIGALALFSPRNAEAFDLPAAEPVVPYVAPTSVQRRNQLCIEEWRKSHAFTQQECRGIWVGWDSYTINAAFFSNNNDEAIHMKYSKCLVNVECRKGSTDSILSFGEHNAALHYNDVHKLRRCKENSGTLMNTHCDPLTDQDINDAMEEFEDRQNQQSYEDQKYGQGYTGQTFGE
ncbi:MAG: hypothetical protein OXC66_01375 [Roseovarius sp.]|nr:hypothetical protein [Roseovarius sp.]